MKEGFLLINKPVGPTSHDMVNKLKRLSGRKAGHAGTLDPAASGLLIIALGSTTRLLRFISGLPKKYVAQVTFGVATDTDDAEGQIIETNVCRITAADIESTLPSFQGKITQRPPVYSAIKEKGVPLYKKARRGEVVEARERQVEITALTLLSFTEGDNPMARMEIECSSGTYIRSLARDLGVRLGCGAHLSGLVRSYIGPFDLNEAVPEEDLTENWSDYLLTPEKVLSFMPQLAAAPAEAHGVLNGKHLPELLPENTYEAGQTIRIIDSEERLIAIIEVSPPSDHKTYRYLVVLPSQSDSAAAGQRNS